MKFYLEGMLKFEMLCLMIGGMVIIVGGVFVVYVGFFGGNDLEM